MRITNRAQYKRYQTYSAQVVGSHGAARNGREEENDTVVFGVVGVVEWEGGIAKEALTRTSSETREERINISLELTIERETNPTE